jgi:hypothetical protein
MNLGGLVAPRRAPHHPARVSHVDDQLVELVLHDPHEPLAPEMQPDRHPVGRHGPSPLTDRTGRRSWRQTVTGGWCETPSSEPPIPTIRAVSAWQRWSDRSHEPELAAALEDGGATGKDRGGDLVVRGPAVSIRDVLDAARPPSLVDEVETTEVEMTHD